METKGDLVVLEILDQSDNGLLNIEVRGFKELKRFVVDLEDTV